MIRAGVCMVPFSNPKFDHPWLQPKPTVASWRALRSIGVTDVRLQFNVGGTRAGNGPEQPGREAPVSEHPGDWDTSLFRAFIEPAFAAGMRVNANYVVGAPVPAHQDAAFYEASAYRFAREFGSMIDSYSFWNEPGADAQKYEEADGAHGDFSSFPPGDYMRDVYMPTYEAVARGIRRVISDAWIIGCDADSADIQARFLSRVRVCNEESIHPYGEVIDQSYSTLAAFAAVRSHRPWGITEIDSHEPGKLYDFTASVFANPDGCTRLYHLFEGNEGEYFEPVRNADGKAVYSSFYAPKPIVNASGRKYAELFAKWNGPIDPVKRTPVKRRRPVKS